MPNRSPTVRRRVILVARSKKDPKRVLYSETIWANVWIENGTWQYRYNCPAEMSKIQEPISIKLCSIKKARRRKKNG